MTKNIRENNVCMHDIGEASELVNRRIKNIITNLIGERSLGKVLDIGERNPLLETLEKHYSISGDSTNIDLDIEELNGEYDTVFCFEVLEHLFNPLHLLLEIKKILKKDGVLYLSTPKGKPHFLSWKHHFHEIYERDLLALFKRAGFKVNKLSYHRIRPFGKVIGFRPLLRFFLERKTVVELIIED